MNLPSSPTHFLSPNRTIVWVISFGLILLIGVTLLSDHINASLAAVPTTSVPVTAAPQPTTPVAVVSQPQSNQLNAVQSILNHPANFRVVPKDISPVQAFVQGKTTKFLIGL